jgi:hypothetical protein
MTNIVPSFGGEPNPLTMQYVQQQDALTRQMMQNNAAKQMAMGEMQTADLKRRGDAFNNTMSNADKLVAAAGVAPLLAILNGGVDPAQGMNNSAAMEYGAQYGMEADQLRLMQDYARGFKDAGQGAAYFVDKVGAMPDLAAMGNRQWPGFASVPRGSELGGSGGAQPRLKGEIVEFYNKTTKQRVGIVSSSDNPAWATNLNNTHPEIQELRRQGNLEVRTRPLFTDGTYGDYQYRGSDVPVAPPDPADPDAPPAPTGLRGESDLFDEYNRWSAENMR